jgi:hypothetical protein
VDQPALYQQLAQGLMEVCPRDFTAAEIVATVEDDWSEIRYNCTTPAGERRGLPAPAAVDFRVDGALAELRRGMKQDGRAAWTRCTFRLTPDGQFKLDVGYPD